jgi:hypothetical protein
MLAGKEEKKENVIEEKEVRRHTQMKEERQCRKKIL